MKHLNSQKGIAPIIAVILLAIVLVGGGAYLLGGNKTKIQPSAQVSVVPTATPTPDATANWKTYTNTDFGIEFKYPLGWDVAQTLDSQTPTLVVGLQKTIDQIKKVNFAVDGGYTPIAILKENSAIPETSDSTRTVASRATVVGGLNAVEYTTTWRVNLPGVNAGDINISTHIKNANTTYVVQLVTISYREIYNQILSTFKFTDQNQATSTISPTDSVSNVGQWQEYNKGQLLSGLSISYPAGWIVQYKKEFKSYSGYFAKYRLSFDFAPPGWKYPNSVGWMGWGEMSFDIYDPQTDINQLVNKYYSKYKDGLVITKDANIANKQTFLLKADGKTAWSDGWQDRVVILGNDYSYETGYSQNGAEDFIKILREEIFPLIHIN